MRKAPQRPFPCRCGAQRLALDKARQALGQTGGGGAREQLLGAGDAVPARKRLRTLDLSGHRIDLRLEHDRDLLMGDHRREQIVALPPAARRRVRRSLARSLVSTPSRFCMSLG